MDAPITDAGPVDAGQQFVRMGLNKSIVVRLPAEARDVIVGNPEIIDAVVRRKNMAYVFARQIGQSNIFFFDANGEQILALDIEVAVDSLALKKLINRTYPGNRITVDTVNQNVVLGGFARSTLEAKMVMQLATQFASGSGGSGSSGEVGIVNTMKVAGEDQVLLKVKIVEIQRDALKRLGVDVRAAIRAGQDLVTFASPFGIGGAGTAFDGSIGNNVDISAILQALETDGLSRTLAEPNLTALTGKSARFNAGGEFAYTVCTGTGTDRACGTDFKPFGVGLTFSPSVLENNRIGIALRAEVSELSGSAVNGVPSLNTRNTETTVELPSGGSMMIAGLIRETTRQSIEGFPGLKKLPLFGALFRSREFRNEQTELVMIVTPYLVNPVAQHKLTTPDKNFNPASEVQSLFLGKLHKNFGANGKLPQSRYNGDVGFIVE